jgi:hypothetical protein
VPQDEKARLELDVAVVEDLDLKRHVRLTPLTDGLSVLLASRGPPVRW